MAPRVYSFSAFQSSSNLPTNEASSTSPPAFNMWIPPQAAQKAAGATPPDADSILNTDGGAPQIEMDTLSASPVAVPSQSSENQQLDATDVTEEQQRSEPSLHETLYSNPFPSSQSNFIEDF